MEQTTPEQRPELTTLRKYLRRYTDLPSLIYLLSKQRITLLDPQTWDDKNDSHFLNLYREKNELESVLAVCFTRAAETYHHWRVFANGVSGVCIGFHREQLLAAVRKQEGVRCQAVKYRKLTKITPLKPATSELPFLKRYPFKPESEFRIVYPSREKLKSKDIPIPLSCIDKITLSPWLNHKLCEDVKTILWSIPDCQNLKIRRSTLINNEGWKNYGESSVNRRRTNSIPRK